MRVSLRVATCVIGVAFIVALPSWGADAKKADPVFESGGPIKEIAVQLQLIEKRLENIDRSVMSMKSIDKSVQELNANLGQVAAILRQENLTEIEKSAADVVLMRGVLLIIFATICGAGLIVLQAKLRHWKPA